MRVRVQWAGRGGRRCEWIDVGGEKENEMPGNNDRDRRDDRRRDDRDHSGARPEPWNLYEIQTRKPRPGQRNDADDSEQKSDFRECGIAFEMKEGKGFNIETYFALPAGARLAIMPRRGRDDRGR